MKRFKKNKRNNSDEVYIMKLAEKIAWGIGVVSFILVILRVFGII